MMGISMRGNVRIFLDMWINSNRKVSLHTNSKKYSTSNNLIKVAQNYDSGPKKPFSRPNCAAPRRLILDAMKKISPQKELRLNFSKKLDSSSGSQSENQSTESLLNLSQIDQINEKIGENSELISVHTSSITSSQIFTKKNDRLINNLIEMKNSYPELSCDAQHDKVFLKKKQYNRLRRRPAAPLPRKHWLFIQDGESMSFDNLKTPEISIFDEDDGKIEQKLEQLEHRQGCNKASIGNDSTLFWRRKLRKNKSSWEFPENSKHKEESSHDLVSSAFKTINSESQKVINQGSTDVHKGNEGSRSKALNNTDRQLIKIMDLNVTSSNRMESVINPGNLFRAIHVNEDAVSRQKFSTDKYGESLNSLNFEHKIDRSNTNLMVINDIHEKFKAGETIHNNRKFSNLKDAGSRIIGELKSKAFSFEQTGIDPSYLGEIQESLKYYPGIEKQMRRQELLNCACSFDELLQEGMGSLSNINLLIRSKAMRNEADQSLQIYDKMLLHGYTPDEDTFISLMHNALQTKDASTARLLFLKMRSRLITPTERTYCMLIKAHVVEGDLESAFALLRKMEDENVVQDCAIYTTLIDGLIKKGKLKSAWQLFHNMRTWKAIQPDEVLFTVMIKACAKKRESEKAIGLLDDMRCSNLHPTDVTYVELINACCYRADFCHKCFDFYNQMKVEDMPLSQQLFEYLLKACASSRDIKKARWVLRELNLNGLSLNQNHYTALIEIFAEAMRVKNICNHEKICNIRYAWHTIRDMSDKGIPIKNNILNNLLKLYINGGYPDFAVEMLDQFTHFGCSPDLTTYNLILRMLALSVRDIGRFFTLWNHFRQNTSLKPNPSMFHLALSMAMHSRSASTTINVLKDLYQNEVYPTPKLIERLYKVGKEINEIHEIVNMFIKLQKKNVFNDSSVKQQILQTYVDEHELKLFQEGKTSIKKATTDEQEIRAKYFDKKERNNSKRTPKTSTKTKLSLGKYIESKKKGGELYALRHDRIKPVSHHLVQAG